MHQLNKVNPGSLGRANNLLVESNHREMEIVWNTERERHTQEVVGRDIACGDVFFVFWRYQQRRKVSY